MPKLPGHGEPDTFGIRLFFPKANHQAMLIMTQSSQLQVGHLVAVEQLTNMYDIDIDTYHDPATLLYVTNTWRSQIQVKCQVEDKGTVGQQLCDNTAMGNLVRVARCQLTGM
ncbi:hypothetical protein CUC08_Gglean011907 [Alternaria sp. MG1]|nr:hypothetical protein CUC08_Gglean011907 [Alternaria sp. MG1]